jgi:glycosyltransferase involved in cell wall biosynthesis
VRGGLDVVVKVAGVLALLLVWYVLSATEVLDPSSVPGPGATFRALGEQLGRGPFWAAVGATVLAWAMGLVLGGAAGLLLGMVVGLSRFFERSTAGVVEFFKTVPVIAVLPLAILVLGTTLTMRLALGKRHPVPRLFQVPGPLHLEHPAFRATEIRTAGPGDAWIGSCRWTCDRYRQSGVAAERLFLSHYGSDLDELAVGTPGRLRGELELDAAVPIVGMVAYMYAPKRYLGQRRGLKGHEDLIDALALCRETRPDLVGVVIGGAWNGATAHERRVRAYGKQRLGAAVRFLGTRSDVPALYPDFDVAVHPSHSENLGGAAESLLLGIPTIATDVGGFPDIVIPERTGWLVPPRRPAALATAILQAVDDRETALRLARQGQVHARRLLDVRDNARQIADIYETVTERRRAPVTISRGRSATGALEGVGRDGVETGRWSPDGTLPEARERGL